MGALATVFEHGTAWASIDGRTMVPHMLPAVRLRGAASSRKNMQLMAMLARRWALGDYTSLLEGCQSVAAKGSAPRHRVSGVRSRGVSTSLMVHIVHLEESVHLCVSGGPRELDMRALNGAIDLLARAIMAGDGEVRGGARGKEF